MGQEVAHFLCQSHVVFQLSREDAEGCSSLVPFNVLQQVIVVVNIHVPRFLNGVIVDFQCHDVLAVARVDLCNGVLRDHSHILFAIAVGINCSTINLGIYSGDIYGTYHTAISINSQHHRIILISLVIFVIAISHYDESLSYAGRDVTIQRICAHNGQFSTLVSTGNTLNAFDYSAQSFLTIVIARLLGVVHQFIAKYMNIASGSISFLEVVRIVLLVVSVVEVLRLLNSPRRIRFSTIQIVCSLCVFTHSYVFAIIHGFCRIDFDQRVEVCRFQHDFLHRERFVTGVLHLHVNRTQH